MVGPMYVCVQVRECATNVLRTARCTPSTGRDLRIVEEIVVYPSIRCVDILVILSRSLFLYFSLLAALSSLRRALFPCTSKYGIVYQ